MAKQGKDFEFAGIRVQIDPLILVRRVITRQKLLLFIVATIGGILTIGAYLKAEKVYRAESKIGIRAENFEEAHLNKILTTAGSFFLSEQELILILNELDLYAATRARYYELAIQRLRGELQVAPGDDSIGVAFKSKDPAQAQLVVAFAVERLMQRLGELNNTPYDREIEAINRALREAEPRLDAAQLAVSEFQSANPEVVQAVEKGTSAGGDGSGRRLDDQIREIERQIAALKSGAVVPQQIGRTPGQDALDQLRSRLAQAKAQYTENHPTVVALAKEVKDQERVVRDERAAASGARAGASPEEARRAQIATLETRKKSLLSERVAAQSKSIRNPELMRDWEKLVLARDTARSQVTELQSRRNEVAQNRVLESNRFQENFRLLEKAQVPKIPVEPKKAKFLGVGIGATAVIGLLLALLREALRQTFVSAQEVEESTGLAVLATLPNIGEGET